MKKLRIIFCAILFLTGMSIALYPYISNRINEKHASSAITSYDSEVKQLDEEKVDALKEAATKYNDQLSTVVSAESTESESSAVSYADLVDVGESLGYITIPKIDVNLPIYSGTSDDVLAKGVGHMEQSSYPLGGESTHCVLTGHRGLPSAQLFTKLDRLKKGDIFTLHVYDQVLTYEVDQIAIVEPEDYGLLQIEEGQDLCTLFTCTPYGINTHRLLVRGHRIENRAGSDVRVTSDAAKVSSALVAVCIAIPLLIISFLVADRSASRSKKKNKK